MKRLLVGVICFLLLFSHARLGMAAMTSTNFQINWDDVNAGGIDASTSTNFSLRDTIGDTISGTSTSANYQISQGYRAPEGNDTLSLIIKSQETATQVAYTTIDTVAKTVTVADASGFIVGDYIAVVENKGFSQKVVTGKISSISGSVLTVDVFDGATGVMTASPAGGNDYVYRLGGATVAFGTISVGSENTAVAIASVLSSVSSGYTVYVQANQILQTAGADTIPAVTDGVVSTGSQEYGASVTGTWALIPDTDMGVTTTQRAIQSHGAATVSGPERVAMTYKLSVTANTVVGSYSQSVFYTLTANY